MAEPKSISVIPQDLNGRASPITKHVQRPGKWIALELLLAQASQAIDPAAEIDRLHRHQDARLRRGLDHADSHTQRLRLARSGAVVPFHWMRSLPRGPSNSITHSNPPIAGGATNSKNEVRPVLAALAGLRGPADSASRRSLPYSKCKTSAVRQTPCSLANSVAALHRRSGIGWRPTWDFLQRSKRP